MQVEQLDDGMVFYLSALPINSYDALKEIYTLCEQGKLKGQTLSHAKKGTNAKQPDLKSNNFKCLRGIELSVVNRLLTELKDCNLSAGQLEPFRKLNFSGPTLPESFMRFCQRVVTIKNHPNRTFQLRSELQDCR